MIDKERQRKKKSNSRNDKADFYPRQQRRKNQKQKYRHSKVWLEIDDEENDYMH